MLQITTFIRIALIAVALLLPMACSHMQTATNSRESLEQAVDLLWKARVAKDYRSVYAQTDMTYQQAVTADQFLQKRGFTVLSYETRQIEITGDNALVDTIFETSKMAMKMKLKMREKWLFEQGAWRLNLTDMMREGPFGPWGTGGKKE